MPNKNKKDEKLIRMLEEREKLMRLRWSVLVRYIVIGVVVAVTLLGYQFGLHFKFTGVLIAAALAFIFNIASSLVYRTVLYPRVWPYLGIFLDMIVITIVVHYTGGIESVFLPLYLLQLVGTNLHFSRAAGPVNFIFGGNLFIFLVLFEQLGVLPHYTPGFLSVDEYKDPQFLLVTSITVIALMGISTYRSSHVVWSLQTVERKLFEMNENLVRTNQELLEANQRLSEVDRMKTEFISVASHQMRTPLSAIKWALNMVMNEDLGPLTKEQRDVLQKGYMSNERMIGLINDLLNVSRIEEGRFQYQFHEAKIEDIVEHTIEDMRSEITTKAIHFTYRKPPAPLPKVRVDSQKIQLALQNVLDNACKYTQQGGKVTLVIQQEGSHILFTIKDNGVGIPENQYHRIFSKFFRADNVIRMQTEGSGLGLFIVKQIIEKHGGSIWFESKMGHGTTFSFTLAISPRAGQRKPS